ncbi:MAG: polyprenyl synthetase family protein [Chromatiales bacterium]|nr:polyprenyl synthetase family protein [Chromatiales bacterium]
MRARIEAALDARLPPATLAPAHLHAAMRYAALGGGKRLRAGAGLRRRRGARRRAGARSTPPACAVELIHAYSLVHDDLPCHGRRRPAPRQADRARRLRRGHRACWPATPCRRWPSSCWPSDPTLADAAAATTGA